MEPPSEKMILSITETVSDALGRPIRELPPLFHAVDIDGLDALVTDDSPSDTIVAFTYAGARVFVLSRETVYVRPIDSENDVSVDMAYFDE